MKKRILLIVMLGSANLCLSAFGKTVEWEEEVPLNTGATIWVRRVDTYKGVSADANPLKRVWGLDSRKYEFEWQRKHYSYKSRPESFGPAMLYVHTETKKITIVDTAWPICAGYGEYQFDDGEWVLQKAAGPTLIGQPLNLMIYYSVKEGAIPERVTQEWIRRKRFDIPQNGQLDTHLKASKVDQNCSFKDKS